MIEGIDLAVLPVMAPAVGALLILMLDRGRRVASEDGAEHKADALAGIRLGFVAAIFLVFELLLLRNAGVEIETAGRLLVVDAFARFGLGFLVLAGLLVLALSLTHFGMARSRPAEPIALLLFSLTGMCAAVAGNHLLVLLVAFELAWLPMIALVAIDSRRLSSSESSLKAFFAHAFASLVFAQGVAFVFGATGQLELSALGAASVERPLMLQVGVALILVGLLARSTLAPFHPWAPDVYEGAPSFVASYVATAAQAATFLVLIRVLHTLPVEEGSVLAELGSRVPTFLGWLGCLGLVWGHAMALVQVGLRRLIGWLGVGQVGFFALALVDVRGSGGEAMLLAMLATAAGTVGAMAILSSLSHHGRACEQVGDLAGMLTRSPIRAALLTLFLLSLGGFPGTFGFRARLEVLSSVEHGGHRGLLVAGLLATVFALAAVGRPLLAMLRPDDVDRDTSRALTNEQLVLVVCGVSVVYFGMAPEVGAGNVASRLVEGIAGALASLRG